MSLSQTDEAISNLTKRTSSYDPLTSVEDPKLVDNITNLVDQSKQFLKWKDTVAANATYKTLISMMKNTVFAIPAKVIDSALELVPLLGAIASSTGKKMS